MEEKTVYESMEAEVTMEVTDVVAETIKDTFNCEVEMLSGSITKLENGNTRYEFTVKNEKAEMIREFILRIISNSHKQNLN